MKKLFLLGILLTSVFLVVGCSVKDDNSTEWESSSVTGIMIDEIVLVIVCDFMVEHLRTTFNIVENEYNQSDEADG